ncbi:type ii secretion system (t2ss), protein e, n-terminal domain [Plakobranchus ocellatus]|uniref:Type ii secretion system (T2ss), protein e, n-terminal domain n=1 Tax=Plakobranchus ocellatus TaxID=259542 RepID=A0AAV3ZJM0_9GAST|nr:type ii secretion system (t2ss), protein e, n-terminal domain [Plakobranchus ocellatus]
MTVGWLTLDVGEKALIYDKDGCARIEEGPQRLFLFREKYKLMTCYSASQKEYIEVSFKSGKTEHIRGPCKRHLNEILHTSICVKPLISLDANEALIVYTQDDKTKQVQRRIQYGPTLFLQGENEWLHEFSWHGTDPENKTRIVAGQNCFTVLKITPDQFYYNVDEVRTADDALLRIKLMMFYEVINIEQMLNSTQDPMADFVNCLTADVVAFAAKKSYEEFIETASDLNHLSNYPQLCERCKAIGYRVSKVVFRGYFAHDKLQQMHDMMIKRRTELKLKYEQEVQEQSMTDMKLKAEVDRMEQEQEMELEKLLHEQKMEKASLEHHLALEKKSHERKISKMQQEDQARLNAQAASDHREADYLSSLHAMQVDVTSLLVTRTGHPEKVTCIVADKNAANIHLYHNDPQSLALSTTSL